MFEQFPKRRPPLPPALARIYATHYRLNRDGRTPATSVSSRLERWLHRRVAADVARGGRRGATLEIGAGTLNQLDYEPPVGPYDIVEPFRALCDGSAGLARIRDVFDDVAEVPAGRRYDRITSVATFEHVLDLPQVVARCALLLAPGGTLRVAIPSEGTLLWTLGWRLTTGIEFRLRYGLDYADLMRHEHVNTAAEIVAVLGWFFRRTRRTVFGLTPALSLYQFIECADPDPARARQLLYGAEAAR